MKISESLKQRSSKCYHLKSKNDKTLIKISINQRTSHVNSAWNNMHLIEQCVNAICFTPFGFTNGFHIKTVATHKKGNFSCALIAQTVSWWKLLLNQEKSCEKLKNAEKMKRRWQIQWMRKAKNKTFSWKQKWAQSDTSVAKQMLFHFTSGL